MPKIQMRRDTAANWKSVNPILLSGEWALETDTKKMKIGDGSTAYNSLPYSTAEDGTWQKPVDWIDIRSGARNNSVYFLIAHATPVESEGVYTVSQYNKFACRVDVSNSGTYDVYIDGMKAQTNNSGSTFVLDWAALYTAGTVVGGFEVSYPSQFVTHVVRITPSLGTNKLTTVTTARPYGESANNYPLGVLWSHVSVDYAMTKFATGDSSPYFAICPIQVAVTANNNVIEANYCGFPKNSALRTVPVLKNGILVAEGLYSTTSLNTITVDNFRILSGTYNVAGKQFIKVLTPANETVNVSNVFSYNVNELKEFPQMNLTINDAENFLNNYSGQPVSFDFTNSNECKKLEIKNSSGVKAVTVSNEAPFDKTSSPQLSVAGCALSRAALVNLFKSMPYNVGYTVVGTPTIVDGVVSGFSGNDYLNTSTKPLSCPNEGKIAFHYTRQSSMNQILIVCQYSSYFPFRIRFIDRTIQFTWMTDNTTQVNLAGTYSITEGDYYITFNFSNNVWIVKLYNSANELLETLTSDQTSVYWPSTAPSTRIGHYSSTSYWQGSIDLNNTYIKVNGVTWFNGAATRQLDPAATNVGGVTITNGVASGFSGSKYVTVPFDTTASSWNVVLKAKRNTGTSDMYYISSDSLHGLTATESRLWLSSDGSSWDLANGLHNGPGTMPANTDCLIRFMFTGTQYTYDYSVDNGTTWINIAYFDTTTKLANAFTTLKIGQRGSANYMIGTIDLNNTYIISNGTKVFSGMVPMTKTCSVVGCTGTADLTADDKAIATGKGWELTVA